MWHDIWDNSNVCNLYQHKCSSQPTAPINNLHLSPYQCHWLSQIYQWSQLKSSHHKPSQQLARPVRHISIPFAYYLIITSLSSPRSINPFALPSLFESPLKFSVSWLLAAIYHALISPHTLFLTLSFFIWSFNLWISSDSTGVSIDPKPKTHCINNFCFSSLCIELVRRHYNSLTRCQ